MIKVNLLKNQSEAGDGGTDFDFNTEFEGGGGSSDDQKMMIFKVVIILVPTLLLYFYEGYSLDNKRAELKKVSAQVSQLTNKKTSYGDVAGQAKKQQEKIEELENRIAIIQNLSKIRLRELRAFDYIQDSIPDKVWLNSLVYRDDGLKISGFAVSDEGLSQFINALERKTSFFKNVLSERVVDGQSEQGAVKLFDLTAGLVGEGEG